MTEADIRQVFRRFKDAGYTNFQATEGAVIEWTRAFRYVERSLFTKAVDRYINTGKWAPKISEIHSILCALAGDPTRRAKHNSTDREYLWKHIVSQFDKGFVYIREPHPRGYISRFRPLKEVRQVGEWRYGSNRIPRFVYLNDELPPEEIGEGETWSF